MKLSLTVLVIESQLSIIELAPNANAPVNGLIANNPGMIPLVKSISPNEPNPLATVSDIVPHAPNIELTPLDNELPMVSVKLPTLSNIPL